jgi:hypothetical protein
MLSGFSIVGHPLEPDGIAATDPAEGLVEALEGRAPMWTSLEVDQHDFGCPGLV